MKSDGQFGLTFGELLYEPETGDTLGYLASELAPNEFIWRFQAIAPKNYRYEVCDENDSLGETLRTEMKCKGHLLTANVKKSIDWEIYEALMEHRLPQLSQFYENLLRQPLQPKRMTKKSKKIFKATSTPALVIPNPMLKHCKLSARIFEDIKRTRLMKMNFDKRK